MNLYIISQDPNNDYDTYDSAIVCAPDIYIAQGIHPSGDEGYWGSKYDTWCTDKSLVKVELIGEAVEGSEQGVVLASFNAG